MRPRTKPGDAGGAEQTLSAQALSKLPAVGAVFWAIKIVATTLGESASNLVAIEPLNLGYATGSIIFLVAFAVTSVCSYARTVSGR